MKIFLVPGHGKQDPGVVGPTGLREKDVALQIAIRLERILVAAGHVVTLSRTDDSYLSPEQQRIAANESGASLTVAIHLNGAASPAAWGYEVYTAPGDSPADGLATAIMRELAVPLRGEPARVDLSDGDPDKESHFRVLLCKPAAVLIEYGFLSHAPTEQKFRNPARIEAVAMATAVAIDAWIFHRNAKGASA